MTTKDKIKASLLEQLNMIQNQINLLESVPGLEKLDLNAGFWGTCNIDFNQLTHDQVIQVIQAIGGKWDKTPADNGTIDYTTKVGDLRIRCWQGQPPPHCKIVEELVEIPAQEARMVTRRKLVCQ